MRLLTGNEVNVGVTTRVVLAAFVAVTMAGLAGCTNTPAPAHTPGPTSASDSSPSPEPEPDPELIPGGTAEENLPYFDFVNSAVLADGNPGGGAIIDNLIAAGFDRTTMEVTADSTPLGHNVDSLQFSVHLGEQCLVGQIDGSGYTSIVTDALQSGRCLVGNTRAIDW